MSACGTVCAYVHAAERNSVIVTKSAFDPPKPADGYRILVEPVWPRGLAKGKGAGCDWMRTLYPSANLRDRMRRNPRKVDTFRDSYLLELASNETAVNKVCRMLKERGTVTILTVPEDTWGIHETLAAFLRATCE